MESLKDKIIPLLNTFHKASGLEAFYFDTQLNILSGGSSKKTVSDFICLGMGRITAFLTENFSSPISENQVFYTYFLEGNLVCDIVFLIMDESYIGALVTQPVFIDRLSQNGLEALLDRINPPAENRNEMRSVLLRVPAVAYSRIMPVGHVLSSLSQAFLSEKLPQQVLRGGSGRTAAGERAAPAPLPDKVVSEGGRMRHTSFEQYLQIKEYIQKGDAEALLGAMSKISAGSIPMDQLQRSDFVRSLKDSFIKSCALGAFAAVEANAPYYRTMDLVDETIRQMEALDNINDIYELMKNTMVAIARSVAVGRIVTYSKPVRGVLEHIEIHYAEKITLDTLAREANLSASYLSNLIKKETGMNLMDNINKVRISHSKKLLLNMNRSIFEVARLVGFQYPNHYAVVFKKFTGLSPTEYRNSLGHKKLDKTRNPDELFFLIVEQLRSKLLMFPDLYDIARIVDPVNHLSWIVNPEENTVLPGTCYDFWRRNESCKNCVSTMAYLKNRPFFKIDCQNEDVFLVLAAPNTVSKSTYVIEVLKKITGNVYIDIGDEALPNSAGGLSGQTRDALTGLFNRQYIDNNLPLSMRRSRLEGKPFSIVLSMISGYEAQDGQIDNDTFDEILREYAQAVTGSLEDDEDWAGRYAGNIFLMALTGADSEEAEKIARKVENRFKDILSKFESAAFIRNDLAVKTLSEDIQDAGVLVHQALIQLNAEAARKNA